MHYLALYRKYRPTNFNEVVGQDKVITVIKNEIINNRISHAYLFSGPRGTGKTTTAKTLRRLSKASTAQVSPPTSNFPSTVMLLPEYACPRRTRAASGSTGARHRWHG